MPKLFNCRAIKLMHGLPIPGQPQLYVSIKQTESQRKGGPPGAPAAPPPPSQGGGGRGGAKNNEEVFSPQITVDVKGGWKNVFGI